jgi:folate-binding protein YgfZ
MPAARLPDRGILAIAGPEAAPFLAGVVTSSIERTPRGQARLSAVLTPQGKIIVDFLAVPTEGGFLLDVPDNRLDTLSHVLKRYRLRSKVDIVDRSDDIAVMAVWGATPAPPEAVPDPRLPGVGARAYLAPSEADARSDTDAAIYHADRIGFALPEGGKDYAFDETFPHEADLDLLGGIDFDKGCYVGQEVVSRMQHRGTTRSRVLPVRIQGDAPAPFASVSAGERRIGTMGSSAGDRGLALLRLDRVAEAAESGVPIECDGARLTVLKPLWAPFDIPGTVAE